MSKKKRRKKKRRPAVRIACGGSRNTGPCGLLGHVATALMACEKAGLAVTLSHGAVITREGYVLPLGGGKWGARVLLHAEFPPAAGEVDD